jgi:hypothetical protein
LVHFTFTSKAALDAQNGRIAKSQRRGKTGQMVVDSACTEPFAHG